MVPKASPSAPPTKKRRWTPLHHLSCGSALDAVVEAASVAALAAAMKTAARREARRFRPIVIAFIISTSSRLAPDHRGSHVAPGLAPALVLPLASHGVGRVARAAAALLEIGERPDLAGHFERVAIDRVMPAFDVDCSLVPGETQFADDPRPVAIAESGGAHLHERQLAEHAVLADHVPAHCRVLAVDVEDALGPFADLGDRIDQIHELMAGLPFEAEIVVGELIEHHFPGVGGVGDVPVAGRPIAVHRAVLEGDAYAPVGRAPCKLPPHRLEARQALGQRPVADAAGEAGDDVRPEQAGIVDQDLPAAERLAIEVLIL